MAEGKTLKSNEFGKFHVSHYDALFEGGVLDNVVVNAPVLEYRGFRLIYEGMEVHKPYLGGGQRVEASDRRLLPKECRERGVTYGGSCFLKMKLLYKGRVIFDDFKSGGTFPIMLRSRLCHSRELSDAEIVAMGEDPKETGGYFIVNGNDKVVRFHIAYKRNHLFVTKSKQKNPWYSEYGVVIRSVGRDELGQKNEIKLCSDGNIHVRIYLKRKIYNIPIIVILRALSGATDKEIYEALGSDKRVLNFLGREEIEKRYSQRECLEQLGLRFRNILRIEDAVECGKEVVRRTLFVHLDKFEDKYSLLLESVRRLYLVSEGKIEPDNIDLPSNHEILSELQLISVCVREKLEDISRHFISRIIAAIRTRIPEGESTITTLSASEAQEISAELSEPQVSQILKSFSGLDFSIGAKITKFLSTGSLTTTASSDITQDAGFTIIAERINYWRFASHFQSVSRGAYFMTVKISRVRKLRPEGWGFICPVHTPDGSPCGILLHLAQECFVRSIRDNSFDPQVCFELGLIPDSRGTPALYRETPCFYNGRLIGWSCEPQALAYSLRMLRSQKGLCLEICYEEGPGIKPSIYIYDTPGAMMRQVLNTSTNRLDWIGAREQVFLDIKLAPYRSSDRYQTVDTLATNDISENATSELRTRLVYREIKNTSIFSTVAATIPFANHNPSPRNIYQCQMAKQAMGVASYNPRSRGDIKSYAVNYLQSPIVYSVGYAPLAPFPIGYNCIVAVLSYTAYDMEDAVVINKSARERGLFNAFIYKHERYSLGKRPRIDSTPSIGAPVRPNDILAQYSNDDTPNGIIRYGGSEEGVIDYVRLTEDTEVSLSVSIRIQRNPTIGDKFCSRHGQKGVLSTLWREVDMPFTEQGLRPDIIINPHAFPSRMTIAMLLESIAAKASLVEGVTLDATPFSKNSVFGEEIDGAKDIGEQLARAGFNYYGNEPMYSGVTGELFQTDIFIGTVFYQRLRHMVNDKFQVRTSGAVVATTRQPVGGRKNKGGMRFGEMERDALISHGAASLLRDRLVDCSDCTRFKFCLSCRSFLFVEASGGCHCKDSRLVMITLPYVFKYLCVELMAMNIRVSLDVTSPMNFET